MGYIYYFQFIAMYSISELLSLEIEQEGIPTVLSTFCWYANCYSNNMKSKSTNKLLFVTRCCFRNNILAVSIDKYPVYGFLCLFIFDIQVSKVGCFKDLFICFADAHSGCVILIASGRGKRG